MRRTWCRGAISIQARRRRAMRPVGGFQFSDFERQRRVSPCGSLPVAAALSLFDRAAHRGIHAGRAELRWIDTVDAAKHLGKIIGIIEARHDRDFLDRNEGRLRQQFRRALHALLQHEFRRRHTLALGKDTREMRTAETAHRGEFIDGKRLIQIGVDVVDDDLHGGAIGGKGMRAEDIVIERHRHLIGDGRGRGGRLGTPDKPQAAIGKVIDGRLLQLQHGAGRGQDQAMDAQRFLAVHRDPEIFPALPLLQPVAVIVRHENEQRLPGVHTIAATLIAQPAGAADRMLKHGKRCLAAPAPVPIIGFVISDFIAGAGRHGMQPVAAARQRNRPHDLSVIDQFLQHKITLESIIVLCSLRRL
ncbi:hypothetical protein RHSP_57389 [Rhizobium freirei PRF 81]|uniref:Uncharacterized protein n=1 Tax=Rhizobium freirei PRF 81 TaxID=363754 RepID=N6UWD8_9HYPH|nr:hypothetical protein RHSP_57389 [Rhizobium freirei PRF 81]